jgi:quercetin dioxygenase-like cupin family protein
MRSAIRFVFLGLMILLGISFAQSGGQPTKEIMVANPGEMKWQHDAGDPPGSESIVLRGGPESDGFEIFTRYPAGHAFPPHWHSANERIVLISGKMSIQVGQNTKFLEPGGYAYLPAKEVQKMACVSNTQCEFYVYWDGKLDFHPAK